MRCGTVVGVTLHPDRVTATLSDAKDYGRESVVELCRDPRRRHTLASLCVRPGDYIWTQSFTALWTPHDFAGLKDVHLDMHRTDWRGGHPCGAGVGKV